MRVGSGEGSMMNFIVCTVHLIYLGTSTFKILTGKPTGKGSLGTPRRRWEDNIRMDLKEIGVITRNCVDWTQDRDYWRIIVNAALDLRV